MSKHYMRLDDSNRTRIKVGGFRWFWYRIILSRPAFINWCIECHKPIDSTKTTDLCTCAFELDMKGMI